jgi:excisionase family DNA binding protein
LRWRDDRLSFGETMRLLGISKATLHRWVAEGKIQPLADVGGKQRWFSREEVLALKDKRSISDKL